MRNILGINRIIDMTYDIYREYFKGFLGYSVLMIFLSVTMMYGIIFVVGIFFVGLIGLAAGLLGLFDYGVVGFIIIYLMILPLFIPAMAIMQIVGAGPALAVDFVRKNRKVTFSDMFTFSFKRIMYVITSSIAFYLILFGVLFVIGLPYVLLYFAGFIKAPIWIQIVVGIVFGLIAIGTLFWLSIKGIFYLQVAVCEKKHFFKAVIGSFRMVKGRFKNLLGLILTSGLSYFIIYLSLGGMVSTLSNMMPTLFSDLLESELMILFIVIQLVTMILQIAARVILLPIQHLTVSIAYFNERNRQYAEDLHIRLNRLIDEQKKDELITI